MRRQRNMSQMKEHNKTPVKELNQLQASNLLDEESKTLVTRMLNELRGIVHKLHENINKEIGNIKNRDRKQKRNSQK